MKLVKIENGWKDNVLGINLSIGNVCNHKCWYCFPGANEGNFKFPDIETIKKNTKHLFDYYLKNTNKEIFDIQFVGGEPTHWPKLEEYIKFLKDNYKCLISMTSNGSKSFEVWERIAPYFDRIQLSCHHEYVKIDEFVNLCDYLYEKNVVVSVSVMMDPYNWDKCISLVKSLKNSKHRFTIRYVELLGNNIHYTKEQKKLLSKHRARFPNLFWFWKNNKYYRSKVTGFDDKNKKYKLKDNHLLLNKQNNFFGWECSLGINWINILHDGEITGLCGQSLYGLKTKYNFRSENFVNEFSPTIIPTKCNQLSCNCMAETNMPKKKIIPICIKS